MSIQDFLVWLASAGGATATLAFIAERVPAFQKLTPDQKWYVHLAGSLVIALAAYAVLTYFPANTLVLLAPWFQIVYGVVFAWLANQVAHKVDIF